MWWGRRQSLWGRLLTHFQNEVCHLPCLGAGRETLLSLTGSLAATYQPLAEKLLLANARHFFLRNRVRSCCFPTFSYLSQQAIRLCQNKQDIK
uniref:Uncharacterized protein n=1 Tax=Strix occidentalis caurina TaxID=311401 RepID=A0A8D0ET29_STROC